MRIKKLLGERLILEKYLRKKEEDGTVGELIGTLIERFSNTRNKEDQLQLVLYILLVILSGEEDY